MGINLSECHRSKDWRKDHRGMEEERPRDRTHYNCWGAISFRGATSLSIYTDNTNQYVYKGNLEEHRPELDELYPKG